MPCVGSEWWEFKLISLSVLTIIISRIERQIIYILQIRIIRKELRNEFNLPYT